MKPWCRENHCESLVSCNHCEALVGSGLKPVNPLGQLITGKPVKLVCLS